MKKGVVDIQVNGYMGINFSALDLTIDKIYSVTKKLVECGTIAYCPTIISSSFEIYKKNLPLIVQAMKKTDLAPHILGIHLEGPFISPENGFRGAHNEKNIILPDIEKYKQLQQLAEGKIIMITLAPELPRAIELIQYIRQQSKSIVISLGHHNANKEIIEKACQSGVKCSSHLGNGVSSILVRHPNPLWSQLAEDNLVATFITDGIHLPSEFIKISIRTKTIKRFIVISDSSPIAGLPTGEYDLWGQKAIIHDDGRITTFDGKCLAGSNSTMLQCMNMLASLRLLTENELWQVGFINPLKLLNKTINENDYRNLPEIKFNISK